MKSINLMKNVGRFTPPKSSSPTYPQIVWRFTPPKIVESDLPSNRLYDLPSNRLWQFTPPKIIESDLPSNRLYDLPSNRLWQFTPPKSSSPTYPQIICTIYPQIVFGDLPPPAPEIAKSDLSSNCLCRFTPI